MTPRPSSDPERAINAALDLRDAGRTADAVPVLEAALKAHPRYPRLWQTLGTTMRALERSPDAVAAFAEAARLQPSDVRAAHGVAQASLEAGRAASALFERAHALAPGDGAILLGRAAAQLAEGRGGDAIATLDAIVAANPLWLDGQATLARLRWMMGDDRGFAGGYVRALQADPRAEALWIALIDLLIHVERSDDARATLSAARSAGVGEAALLLAAATCASELGDTAVADAAFARLAGSADVAVVERQARHLLRTGRADAAAARIEPLLAGAQANQLWPYASLAWRLTGDRRIDWLEGDAALVGVVDLADRLPSIDALAARLRTLHRAKRDPLGQSVRGGTQTDGPLFAHESREIQAVRAVIVDAVRAFAASLGPVDATHPVRRHVGRGFRFAGSWSVRLTGAGHHSAHVHPLGWISSAFYVALPPQHDMGAPPAGWLQVGEPPASLGLDLAPYRRIEPKPGRLVLFPSTMWHGTAPIDGGERLSIAFDVAATG